MKFSRNEEMNASGIKLKTHPCFGPRDCALAVCALATILVAPSRAQETQEKIDLDDVSPNYTVHLPGAYDQAHHDPVVILLHARNQDADDMARLTHFNQFADKDRIIAVYPNATRGAWNIGVRPEQSSMAPRRGGGRRGGLGGGWPGGGGGGYPGGGGGGRPSGGQNPDATTRNRPEPADDVAFLNQMLDALALKYSVDTRRIYVAGLEDGGFMALRVGCNMADRVAAIAAVGAALPKTMICLPSRAVPALFMKGTDDPIVPDNGGSYKPGQFHVLSAEDSAKAWAKFDRCAEKPAQDKIPPLQKGGKDTKTYTYSGCQNNAQVVLDSGKGGGRTWPGGEQYMSEKEIGKTSDAINANETVWSFLASKTIAGDSRVEK